uniref:MIP08073p n=1 Tax=Drosophila melanogaster TaxID=7227 RepID=C0PV30_DROME|nr:MIP08073p [Drosophila melanogaster]
MPMTMAKGILKLRSIEMAIKLASSSLFLVKRTHTQTKEHWNGTTVLPLADIHTTEESQSSQAIIT